jgi:hypothetical protein
MTGGINFTNERREMFGYPTQYKECRLDAIRVQKFEDSPSILDDTAWIFVPILSGYVALEARHLEIVFDIDGQSVLDHRARRSAVNHFNRISAFIVLIGAEYA